MPYPASFDAVMRLNRPDLSTSQTKKAVALMKELSAMADAELDFIKRCNEFAATLPHRESHSRAG